MEMNGPADEVGPLERLYRSGDEGLNYLSEVTALGPVEDAPIADQRHIPAPPVLDAAGDLPPSTCSGAHVFVVSQHGCVRCGYDPDEPDEEEILALRELLPRGRRRHVDEMFAADERAEAERKALKERQERLAASEKIADRLEVYMQYLMYGKMRYDDFAEAEDMLRDVLMALRGEIPHRPDLDIQAALRETWDDGLNTGAAWISACCGCSGMGETPVNPFGGE